MKKNLLFAVLVIITGCKSGNNAQSEVSVSVSRTVASEVVNTPWAFDPGPSPTDPMGKELIDIVAQQPFMPGISEELSGNQKFRPAFGPTLWRMMQKPNSVKILFIGQDGTHIAEAAGRTATAGFGGRGQDMAAYFGVNEGAAFINTFAFTIKGQYATAKTPVISTDSFGRKRVNTTSVVDNATWLMSQDLDSPMVKWRNSLIDWIIRNNQDSLKMIVLFGGSTQDAIGTFIRSKGGKVGSRYTEDDLLKMNIKVPLFDIVNAGGNNVYPVALDKNGRDIYEQLLGRRPNYSLPQDQSAAENSLRSGLESAYSKLAIFDLGVGKSGVIHPAQIGGFDLNQIEIKGQRTISLKGLPLSKNGEIKNDILIAEFPHPTYLSISEQENKGSASRLIEDSIQVLIPYRERHWKIPADPGMVNEFDAGKPYQYGRTDLDPLYYDFGTPKNRMVSVSSAYRMPSM
ncbi:MAG: hypothetical protein ACK5WZ_10945, partial [Pseudobdellovibrionaceae bacterium]